MKKISKKKCFNPLHAFIIEQIHSSFQEIQFIVYCGELLKALTGFYYCTHKLLSKYLDTFVSIVLLTPYNSLKQISSRYSSQFFQLGLYQTIMKKISSEYDRGSPMDLGLKSNLCILEGRREEKEGGEKRMRKIKERDG